MENIHPQIPDTNLINNKQNFTPQTPNTHHLLINHGVSMNIADDYDIHSPKKHSEYSIR